MTFKMMIMGFAAIAGLASQQAWCAPSSQANAQQAALAQCISLRTTGADRILAAQWVFAVMSKAPQIVDLSAVTAARTKELDQGFAKLLTRLVTRDCIEEFRPLAAVSLEDALEQVGAALGEKAMNELMSGKDVEKAVGAYGEFLSREDFEPFTDSRPKQSE